MKMRVIPISKIAPDGRLVDLRLEREYEVLGIEADSYRILTDVDHPRCPNDPLLFEPELFQIIDPVEPNFWLIEFGAEGEKYAYPLSWTRPGFFEDYHDHDPAVRARFWEDLQALYPMTWREATRAMRGDRMTNGLCDFRNADGSRHFASLPQSRGWSALRKRVAQLPGAVETGFITDHVFEGWLNFSYRGHRFTVNDQLGKYWFFVSDPACPEEILREVVEHFEALLER